MQPGGVCFFISKSGCMFKVSNLLQLIIENECGKEVANRTLGSMSILGGQMDSLI